MKIKDEIIPFEELFRLFRCLCGDVQHLVLRPSIKYNIRYWFVRGYSYFWTWRQTGWLGCGSFIGESGL